MKVIEILAIVIALVAVQAWCAACAYGALHAAQWSGLVQDTALGRGATLASGFGGFAFAVWTLYQLHRWWGKRR